MNMKQAIEAVVREMLQDLVQKVPMRKVLYVLDDSRTLQAYSDTFIEQGRPGFCHDVLLLDGETAGWLGTRLVECTGTGRLIARDEQSPAPLELPMQYDAIVVPEIDLDQAARIAYGLKGSVKAELVFAALVAGKHVLIGEDDSGLARADRRTLQTTRLPAAYAQQYKCMMKRLQALGIQIVPMPMLVDRLIQCFQPEGPSGSPVTSDEVYEGKLLTAGMLQAMLKRERLKSVTVRRRTIISPLAVDFLKEHGVQLYIKDEVEGDVSR